MAFDKHPPTFPPRVPLEPQWVLRHHWTFVAAAAASIVLGYGVAAVGVWMLVPMVAGPLALVSFKRPFATLLGMVGYIPLEGWLVSSLPAPLVGPALVVPEMALGMAAFGALSRAGASRRVGRIWLAAAGSLAVIAFLSAFANHVSALDVLYWLRVILRYSAAMLIVGAAATSESSPRLERFTVALGVSGAVQGAVALAEAIGGSGVAQYFAPASVTVLGRSLNYSDIDYVHGTLGNYNTLGLFCGLALVAVTVSLRVRGFSKARVGGMLWVGAIFAGLGVLLSQSRQGVIAATTGMVVVLAMTRGRRVGMRPRSVLAPMIVLLVIAALASLPAVRLATMGTRERLSVGFGSTYLSSSLEVDRLFVIVRGVPAALSRSPVWGFGAGAQLGNSELNAASALSIPGYGVAPLAFANDVGWAAILIQTGLLGAAWVLGGHVLTYRRARPVKRTPGGLRLFSFVTGVLVVTGVGMAASFPLSVRSLSVVFWSAVGFAMLQGRNPAFLEETPEGY